MYPNSGAMVGQGYGGENDARITQMPTMQQRLDAAVKQAEDRLASAKRAREILAKNPDIEELLNLLQRGGF